MKKIVKILNYNKLSKNDSHQRKWWNSKKRNRNVIYKKLIRNDDNYLHLLLNDNMILLNMHLNQIIKLKNK